jgi:CBS domain-containing protein
MKAHEIMFTEVHTVHENDNVRYVIEQFIKHRISGLPVVNNQNRVIAYISDGDILRYIGKHENMVFHSLEFTAYFRSNEVDFRKRTQRILDLNVLDIAQRNVITVSWDEEVEDIAAILGKKHFKNVPVERNGQLCGMIGRSDVIRHTFKELL